MADSFSVPRAVALAVAVLLALVLAVVALRMLGRAWPRLAILLAVVLLAVLVVGLPLRFIKAVRAVPRIHDITTDTERPPAFVAIGERRRGAPNPPEYAGAEVAALQRRGYPDLGPVTFAASPERVLAAAEAVARDLGWEIVALVPGEGRLEATATTAWLRFRDDVVIRVAAAGTGSRVDMRSKSRMGRSDLGVNAQRIRAFLGALSARLA